MTKAAPEIERAPERTQTKTERYGDWLRKTLTRIGLDMGGEKERLLLENQTEVPWRIYHNYHQLVILDSGEQHEVYIVKKGSLNMHPYIKEQEVDFLVIQLSSRVQHVYIYRRHVAGDVEIYDLRVA